MKEALSERGMFWLRHMGVFSLTMLIGAVVAGVLGGTHIWGASPLWMSMALVTLVLLARWARPTLQEIDENIAQGKEVFDAQLCLQLRQMGTIAAVYFVGAALAGGVAAGTELAGVVWLFLFPTFLPVISYLAGVTVARQQYHTLAECQFSDNANQKIQKLQGWIQHVAQNLGVGTVELKLENDMKPAARSVERWPISSDQYLVLSQGILSNFTGAQIQSICAHELAHFKARDSRRDFWIGVGVGLLYLPIGWQASQIVLSGGMGSLGVGVVGAGVWMIMALLIVPRYFRRLREWGADQGAAKIMDNPQLVIETLSKLDNGDQEHTEAPTRDVGYLLETHPPLRERMQALEQLNKS